MDATKILDQIKETSNYAVLIFVLLLFIVFIVYLYRKMSQKDENCNTIDLVHKNLLESNIGHVKFTDMITSGYFETTHADGNKYEYELRDFYIKTAYNACCSGKFKNDYVDLCALKLPQIHGVRALDFQIYSLQNEPIIACSTSTSHNFKESINHLAFHDVISKVNELFAVDLDHGLRDAPLFLIFRMHTRNKVVYDKMASCLLEYMDSTRFERYNSNATSYEDHNYNLMRKKMKEMVSKIVFVVVHSESSNIHVERTELGKLVDIYGGDTMSMKMIRINELKNAQNKDMLTEESKIKMMFCMPELENSNSNYNFLIPMSLGFQFVGMNFQNADTDMIEYNNFFTTSYGTGTNTSHVSFVKKPDQLIEFS
jgi:hypothetical protein